MYEPVPDLTPDLDWMLASGQASSHELAELLVSEHYVAVYRLALAALNDPYDAAEVAGDTMVAALLNVYRYRSTSGVRPWLYGLALEAILARWRRQQGLNAPPSQVGMPAPASPAERRLWQAVDELNVKERLALFWQAGLAWPGAEMAGLLKMRPAALEDHLRKTMDHLRGVLQQGGLAEADLAPGRLEAIVAASLEARWPAPEGQAERLPAVARQAEEQARQHGLRRHRTISVKETALTAGAIVIGIALLYFMNILIPDPAAQPEATATQALFGQATVSKLEDAAERLVTPAPTRAEAWAGMPPASVFYVVQPKDDLAAIASKLGVSSDELLRFNRLPDGNSLRAGQRLLIPGQFTPEPVPQATPVPRSAIRTPSAAPVGTSGIYELMTHNRDYWNTLWLDAQMIDYGPASYIGPPKIKHLQLWFSSEQFLLLTADDAGAPDQVYLMLMHKQQLYFAHPSAGRPWFSRFRPYPFGDPTVDVMKATLNGAIELGYQLDKVNLNIIGSEGVAGRETWIVDHDDENGMLLARYWVDQQTGLVLRNQTFGGETGQVVLSEYQVNAVNYDINLPQDLLTPQIPWRGGFARNFSGAPLASGDQAPALRRQLAAGRERLDTRLPESHFDPSSSALRFQYAYSFDRRDPTAPAIVFAGRYALGAVSFGNPWTMICARSNDGRKLAFVSQPDKLASPDAELRWFDLDNPVTLHSPLEGLAVTHLAFAPDSQRLAVFGYSDSDQMGAIYIIELATGYRYRILDLADAKSFVWKPDGQALALIGARSAVEDEHVMVVNIASHLVEYDSSITTARSKDQDWPMTTWGVDFPVEMGHMDSCAAAPHS